jgi:hypothetical protein
MKRWLSVSATLTFTLFLLSTAVVRRCTADPGFDDLEMSGAKAEWDNWLNEVDNAVKSNDKKVLSREVAPGAPVDLVYDGQTVPTLLANDARGWQDVLQTLHEGHVETLDLRRDGRGIRRHAVWKKEKDGVTLCSRDVQVEYSDTGWRVASVAVKDPVNVTPPESAFVP